MENQNLPKEVAATPPDHLNEGQTPADLYPSWTDEKNIELRQDDVDHFPQVLKLLTLVNAFNKTPIFNPTPTTTPEEWDNNKTGDWRSDLSRLPWREIQPLYGESKYYVQRLIFYYGRHIEPKPFDYDPNWPSKMTPYQNENHNIVGYRGIEQFLSNYARIRDYVVKAINWYYENDPSRGEIVEVLDKALSNMKGSQFLLLLKENRRRIDYDKLIEALY